MTKVPPDVDEKATVKEAGFAGVMKDANRVNFDTPLSKTKPGEFTVSTVCHRAAVIGASPQQREQVINVMVQRNPGFLGKRLLNSILKAEFTKLEVDDLQLDPGLDIARKTLNSYYATGTHLIRTTDRSFWAYTGTHWQRVTDEMVKNRVLELIKENKPLMPYSSLMESAFKLLIALQAADGDVLCFLEERPPVINCLNGELWLGVDGKIDKRPHRHDSYLTNCLEVEYDPEAKCPEFDTAIRATFDGDEEMVRHFEEMIGYLIQPRRNIAAWFLLHGSGNNGKTRLMETVQKLMGRGSVLAMHVEEVEGEKFVMGALVGKLMLLDDDVKASTKLPDGFLKKLSERKTLSGQHKFKDIFEFISIALPVLLANNWPRCADLSLGTRRRIQVIPFRHLFVAGVDEDKMIFERIWASELPGVLNRAIAGLQRLQERADFKKPRACVECEEEFFRRAHALKAFLDEGCVHDPTFTTDLREFYRAYSTYCEVAGFRLTETRNTIKGHLENLGYDMVKVGHNRNGVVGVRPMTGDELWGKDGGPKNARPGEREGEIPF